MTTSPSTQTAAHYVKIWGAMVSAVCITVLVLVAISPKPGPTEPDQPDALAHTSSAAPPPRSTTTPPHSTGTSPHSAGSDHAHDAAPAPSAADIEVAREELSRLTVKGRAPRTGFDRELFGPAWSDDVSVDGGHNGCDTRNDILGRDLTDITFKPGTGQCAVLSGTLKDPYSGEVIEFSRSDGGGAVVHIDHIVSLSDAWQKGAQGWDDATRRDFANDPRNLVAVSAGLNLQKSGGDAATWLPPLRSARCDFALRIIEVKSAYGLWVTGAERDALSRQLETC